MSTYTISKENELEAVEFPSVTTILKQLDKSGALIPWALGLAEKFNTYNLNRLIEHMPKKRQMIDIDKAIEVIKKAKDEYKTVGETAMDIGSQVHDLIENHIKMILAGDPIPLISESTRIEVVNGYEAFLKWESENVIEWLESESKIVDPINGYAGTLDAVAVLKPSKNVCGGVNLIDFKTSKAHYPEYGLQLSAYKVARETMSGEYLFEHDYEVIEQGIKSKAYLSTTQTYEPIKIEGIGILRLDKETGLPDWKDYTKNTDRMTKAFLCLVEFYYLFAKRRLKNNKWVK